MFHCPVCLGQADCTSVSTDTAKYKCRRCERVWLLPSYQAPDFEAANLAQMGSPASARDRMKRIDSLVDRLWHSGQLSEPQIGAYLRWRRTEEVRIDTLERGLANMAASEQGCMLVEQVNAQRT
jgi:hypothetical protein